MLDGAAAAPSSQRGAGKLTEPSLCTVNSVLGRTPANDVAQASSPHELPRDNPYNTPRFNTPVPDKSSHSRFDSFINEDTSQTPVPRFSF
ncbi:hypothetical protein BTHE_1466 [Bifidobacterium thermophilum]|nr:hypothetical protein BTHE_1466 [Bifidobacterium thermophilum]